MHDSKLHELHEWDMDDMDDMELYTYPDFLARFFPNIDPDEVDASITESVPTYPAYPVRVKMRIHGGKWIEPFEKPPAIQLDEW